MACYAVETKATKSDEWFYNGPVKDYHWYYCLVVAAQNSQIEMVQDILMSGRDGKNIVWC